MKTVVAIGPILTFAMLFLGIFFWHVGPLESDTGIPSCDSSPATLHIILNSLESTP